ncbi:DUF371 domain-containing protein [Haloferax mediterranei ATCC 33500]|uniref:DUF371 domain-containing protein n=1 Tax=Haloferax mediterranei (strain ATCC 33500 / DSM 1411 / JCM 8866 / NBRC 14739 / NCIMB 2177 / R-4) TaxID=523841 RepID=I3R2W4_HALMT|nr:DUF371 domain-containing protein [Haloferax mediterranei]AFK18574.2 hypothetical protein HFX_0853 [Haloferax mediterranei ATCC 33500]AHZ22050.1 hypothetical protein BM92_04970 [Haloferax mediterranei ATCC 33500]EMA02150.1 hypothetical protein C439_06205 [Haloferax mediterranei ATCC 33500]MDX5988663.1 DUF371 domain-containing protein [Haloferax mediterranei ATCC 33500]QCQ75075.1 DUF371 domain-containing protein [Haloferax mediterranei ATCC 33500]
MQEVIRARGHEHVSAEHASTFEVTSDDWLTPAGDCILAIDADRTPADFDPEFVGACQSHDATIDVTVRVEAGEDTYEQTVSGRGHPELTFDGDRSIVFRTSDYVDDRTGVVGAEHAAEGFDRDLVSALTDGADLTVTIEVE